MESPALNSDATLLPEDQARAGFYALLARLFSTPPDAPLLHALAGADELPASSGEAPLAAAWRHVQAAAALTPAEAARAEFDALFIGLGRAPIMPYASFYLAGFLMEKPLAGLRDDLARLGLARFSGVGEPEDHIASLAEVMRFLIAGDGQTPPAGLAAQQQFFRRHIQPWHDRLAADIQNHELANFYKPVAALMQAFFAIEAEAFAM